MLSTRLTGQVMQHWRRQWLPMGHSMIPITVRPLLMARRKCSVCHIRQIHNKLRLQLVWNHQSALDQWLIQQLVRRVVRLHLARWRIVTCTRRDTTIRLVVRMAHHTVRCLKRLRQIVLMTTRITPDQLIVSHKRLRLTTRLIYNAHHWAWPQIHQSALVAGWRQSLVVRRRQCHSRLLIRHWRFLDTLTVLWDQMVSGIQRWRLRNQQIQRSTIQVMRMTQILRRKTSWLVTRQWAKQQQLSGLLTHQFKRGRQLKVRLAWPVVRLPSQTLIQR